jgi:hypothetical protein
MPNARWIAGALGWLDDHQVPAHGQARQPRAIRQASQSQQSGQGHAEVGSLAMVEGLLRQAERPRSPPADLHDHQLGRWPAVDGDDVQLGSPDVDLAREDQPARAPQPIRDQLLRGIAGPLLSGPDPHGIGVRHPAIIGSAAYPRLTRGSIGDYLAAGSVVGGRGSAGHADRLEHLERIRVVWLAALPGEARSDGLPERRLFDVGA